MPFPIIAALISSVLSRKKDKADPYSMDSKFGSIGEATQPQQAPPIQGQQRTWDNATNSYINTGSAGNVVQPGQTRVLNQGTGGYQDAGITGQQQGGGVDVGGIVGTIGSVLGNKDKKNQQGPYQMQMRRR
jgi:hypothetical protein